MTVYRWVLNTLSLDQSEQLDIQIGSSIDKMMVAVEIWPDLKVCETRDRVMPGVKVHSSAVVVFGVYKEKHDKLRKSPDARPAAAPKMGIKQRTGGKYPPCQCKPVGCR
ncbi:hypothetical protein ASPTUDRAFT_56759 [Aspergillus tubingensis CBS 134.48]|uniref:Uncharacterized protein n=1 Tax=Aspergillus tubingensis (strain CBS 134.48) TaxID=767770 RepID=A0A1L9N0B7_ASPTC|nr:hypothetical protein ASPTUDRAFT_56759 [Aspergillus tubingensis CBS 134.48]